jgi:hypothetical protein
MSLFYYVYFETCIGLIIAISGVLNRTFVVPELYKNLVLKHVLVCGIIYNVHIFKPIYVLA